MSFQAIPRGPGHLRSGSSSRVDIACRHIVDRATKAVVLAGSIEADTHTLGSGSFIRLRADEWHSLGTKSGAIVRSSAMDRSK